MFAIKKSKRIRKLSKKIEKAIRVDNKRNAISLYCKLHIIDPESKITFLWKRFLEI